MYEELIKALRCGQSEGEKHCLSCKITQQVLCDDRHDTDAADALEAQSAQLAAKDAEIEQMRQAFKDPVAGLTISNDNVLARLARVTAESSNLRNELCQQCGKYHTAHKGACDGCRWRTPAKQDEEA